jgi:subtilisin-like proprotein convertase family protein
MRFIKIAFLITACCAGNAHAATVFNLAGTPASLAIPDNNATGISVSFNMPLSAGVVQDIWIQLGLTHTWVGDLTATLSDPAGNTFTLFERVGRITSGVGDASDLSGLYRFIDSGSNFWIIAIGTSGNVPVGDYRPGAANTSEPTSWALNSGFVGLGAVGAAGEWKLRIKDLFGGDTGTLSSSTLSITMASVSAIPEPGAALPLAALISGGLLLRTRRRVR